MCSEAQIYIKFKLKYKVEKCLVNLTWNVCEFNLSFFFSLNFYSKHYIVYVLSLYSTFEQSRTCLFILLFDFIIYWNTYTVSYALLFGVYLNYFLNTINYCLDWKSCFFVLSEILNFLRNKHIYCLILLHKIITKKE